MQYIVNSKKMKKFKVIQEKILGFGLSAALAAISVSLIFPLGLMPRNTFANEDADASSSQTKTVTNAASTFTAEDALGLGTQKPADPIYVQNLLRLSALGRDPVDAVNDPFYVTGQKIIVSDGERQATYMLEEANPKYNPPSGFYDLEKDVDVSFDAGGVAFEYTKNGKTYTRHFYIEGVQHVLKDKVYCHILLKSGDVYTINFANSKLFDANAYAYGGPLALFWVGTVPVGLIDRDTHLIPASVSLEFYDSRKRPELQGQYSGDVLILDGDNVVDRSLTLSVVTENVAAHIASLEKRELLLRGLANLDADVPIDVLAAVAELPQQLGVAGAAGISSLPTAHLLRPAQKDWDQNPTEQPGLHAPALGAMQSANNAMLALAGQAGVRSTYPHAEEAIPEEGTPEKRIYDQQKQLLSGSETNSLAAQWAQEKVKKKGLGALVLGSVLGVGKFGKKLIFNKKTGLVVAASGIYTLAAMAQGAGATALLNDMAFAVKSLWNQFSYVLPSAVRDLGYTQNLFSIPFTDVKGPEVSYLLKNFLAIFGYIGLTLMTPRILALKPIVKKVMGYNLPYNKETGWRVFFTLSARMVAQILRSYRGFAAAVIGKDTAVRAARQGIGYKKYLAYKEAGISDPVQMVAAYESEKLKIYGVAVQIWTQILLDNGDIDKGTVLSKESLSQHWASEEAYNNSQKRLFLAMSRVYELQMAKGVAPCLDEQCLGELKKEMLNDQTIKAVLEDPKAPLTDLEAEVYEKCALRELAVQERLAARLSGNEVLFQKYRRGEASDHVIRAVVGNNFEKDMVTVPIFTTLIHNYNSTDPLLARFQHVSDNGLMGLFGWIPLIEFFVNVANWCTSVITEELNFARKEATNLPAAYQAPDQLETVSVAKTSLANLPSESFRGSMRKYLKTFGPSEIFHGVQKLGDRITIAQFKNLKPMIVTGAVLVWIGFMLVHFTDSELLADSSLWENIRFAVWEAPIMSTYKVLLINVWNYLMYRIFWMYQNNGMGYVKTDTHRNSLNLAKHLALLNRHIDVLNESTDESEKSAAAEKITKDFKRVEAIYNQNNMSIPNEIADYPEPKMKAIMLSRFIMANPPFHTSHNTKFEWTATMVVGAITTVIGLYGSVYAWKFAEVLNFWEVMAPMLGLYVFGKGASRVGKRGRGEHHSRLLRKLRKGLDSYKDDDFKSFQNMFSLLLSTKEYYRTFEVEIPKNVVDFDHLSWKSDPREEAGKLYFYMLSNPPFDQGEAGYRSYKNSNLKTEQRSMLTNSLASLRQELENFDADFTPEQLAIWNRRVEHVVNNIESFYGAFDLDLPVQKNGIALLDYARLLYAHIMKNPPFDVNKKSAGFFVSAKKWIGFSWLTRPWRKELKSGFCENLLKTSE